MTDVLEGVGRVKNRTVDRASMIIDFRENITTNPSVSRHRIFQTKFGAEQGTGIRIKAEGASPRLANAAIATTLVQK